MKLNNCGKIRNQEDHKFYLYELRILEKADLPKIMILQEQVIAAMVRNDYCVPLTAVEYLELLSCNGEALGLFIGKRLVAVCGILFPGDKENNMARELNFSTEKLLTVAQLEIALVHPSFQGNCLQQKMALLLIERAQSIRRCNYLFTTVSPYNYPSLQTVTSLGMYLAKVCKRYFQWDRYVAYRDFVEPIELDTANTLTISNADLEEQQVLIACGYLGFAQLKGERDINILFAKKQVEERSSGSRLLVNS